MENHSRIAAEIFRLYGLSFDTAQPAGGWTNAVWLNGGYALRLSKERGSDRIRREARLSRFLPLSAGYPENISTGTTDGYEWSLSKRIQGQVLSEVWGGLSWSEKLSAVRQILGIVTGIRSVEISKAEHLTSRRAWYSSFNTDESFADVIRYEKTGILSAEQSRIFRDMLERFYTYHYSVKPVLNHGDITADNLIWHEGKIVSLLDFEHAVIAPGQLDLHSLVNLALVPYNEEKSADIALTEEKDAETQQYVRSVIPLFEPFLAEQGGRDLFFGYNILYRQRFLEFWLKEPDSGLDECDAYRKLSSLLDGRGGYLHEFYTEEPSSRS